MLEAPRRVQLGPIYLDAVDLDTAGVVVVERALSRKGGLVLTPNVAIARQMETGEFNAVKAATFLWLLDGVPLGWVARLAGLGVLLRVPGSDLLPYFVEQTKQSGCNLAILGAGATAYVQKLREHDDFNHVSGGDLPYGGSNSDELRKAALLLLPLGPTVVFLGLGFPKQEELAVALLSYRPDCVFVGCGAAAEMASGVRRRSPAALQRLGLEWLWRLAQEPRRLYKRYLVEDGPWLLRQLSTVLWRRVLSRSER